MLKNPFDHPPGPLPFGRLRTGAGASPLCTPRLHLSARPPSLPGKRRRVRSERHLFGWAHGRLSGSRQGAPPLCTSRLHLSARPSSLPGKRRRVRSERHLFGWAHGRLSGSRQGAPSSALPVRIGVLGPPAYQKGKEFISEGHLSMHSGQALRLTALRQALRHSSGRAPGPRPSAHPVLDQPV